LFLLAVVIGELLFGI